MYAATKDNLSADQTLGSLRLQSGVKSVEQLLLWVSRSAKNKESLSVRLEIISFNNNQDRSGEHFDIVSTA